MDRWGRERQMEKMGGVKEQDGESEKKGYRVREMCG